MIDLHAADDHATPLTPAEREDLIPTHITLRSELNELEQQNIATANRWAFGRRKVATRESFLKSLHLRMFQRVLALGWKIPNNGTQSWRRAALDRGVASASARRCTLLDRAQILSAGRACRPISSSTGVCTSFSKRKWPLVAAGRRRSDHAARRQALHVGRC